MRSARTARRSACAPGWSTTGWPGRRDDRENDLLGVYVFAVVLLLIPLAEPDANALAALGGRPAAR